MLVTGERRLLAHSTNGNIELRFSQMAEGSSDEAVTWKSSFMCGSNCFVKALRL